jgi:type IV pilus assembly protein PilW
MDALHTLRRRSARRQRGLTLIEFMVSVTIGLMLVAAIATLIADQSGSRAEVDRAGRMIENGRYAVRAMTEDLQVAGYWGELNGVPGTTPLAALPDPCTVVLADLEDATQLHIQGYNAVASGAAPSCVSNHQPGTDILVVRHADPDMSDHETAGVSDLDKLDAAQLYVQTGLNPASSAFLSRVRYGAGKADFTLVKKDKVTVANVRKALVRIYYVAQCSVEVGGSCAGADGGRPLPTLKMTELGPAGWSTITLAEGIENLQIDYGVDTNGDGAPDGADVDGSLITPAGWADVMQVKLYVLARSLDPSPSHFVDDKTYAFGTSGTWTPATAEEKRYKRHVFVQSVRLVNPSARRSS